MLREVKKPTPCPSLKGREGESGTLETPETLETPVLFRFGPKTGVFLVQKRNETPETPETLGTLGTPFLWVSRASHLVSRSQARLVSRASRLVRGKPTPSPSLKGRE